MFKVTVFRHGDTRFGSLADKMYQLRHKVFFEQLKWDVKSVDGREVDCYDDAYTAYCVVTDPDEKLVYGSWRFRPTTQPNMLKDLFTELMDGEPVPCADDVWEISRLAVDHDLFPTTTPGFGMVSLAIFVGTCKFMQANGLTRMIQATIPPVINSVASMGFDTYPMGEPRMMGKAFSIAMDYPLTDNNIQLIAKWEEKIAAEVGLEVQYDGC